MGGYHPTLCPKEVQQHADAVAVGEAEGLWPAIVQDARQGTLRPRYEHARPPDLAGVQPRRAVFAGTRYLPLNVVQFGRGCHHSCDFCCIKAFYKKEIRHRPVRDVVAEIAADGRRRVLFADDNLAADRQRLGDLLQAITPLGLRWSGQISLDFVEEPGLLQAMVRSGCQSVLVGLESLDPANLARMGKGWSRAAEYGQRLAAIRRSGLMIYGTFVFGYDGDRPQSIQRTLEFALQQKLFLANFNHLQPYPGTRLYRRLQRQGRLLYPRWWLDPGYRFGEAVFRPLGMTPEQLTEGCRRARDRFHGAASIARRIVEPRANLGSLENAATFLLVNLVSRQDLRRKRGLRLGGLAARRAGRS
jgi:radical SAM superfamily enzyme YgiQ (UPF0313 family)